MFCRVALQNVDKVRRVSDYKHGVTLYRPTVSGIFKVPIQRPSDLMEIL
jgi:hypothetical protein